MWGRQSCLQPAFRRRDPLESGSAGCKPSSLSIRTIVILRAAEYQQRLPPRPADGSLDPSRAVTGRTRRWHPLSPSPIAASENSETGSRLSHLSNSTPLRTSQNAQVPGSCATTNRPAPEARSGSIPSMWLGTGFKTAAIGVSGTDRRKAGTLPRFGLGLVSREGPFHRSFSRKMPRAAVQP